MRHKQVVILALVAVVVTLTACSVGFQPQLDTSAALGKLGAVGYASKTLTFSGYQWDVRGAGSGGPGPNEWSADNVWVDSSGNLHLLISERNGKWDCAQVATRERFHFGKYQFQVVGRVDQLDKNVVFGLFNYPPSDVGPDGSNEIDIEFTRWGNASNRIGNYTVWPADGSLDRAAKTFSFTLNGTYTTHRFDWSSKQVNLSSQHGHRDDNRYRFASWTYKPRNYQDYIPQEPLPVLINLWLFEGRPPSDGEEVEIIISSFTYTPE
jgi:hypothetical protein